MSIIAQSALPRRNRLLSSCAVAAIATLTVHAPLRAQNIDQGFQGTGSPLNGGATIRPAVTGSKNTTIEINTDRSIINWTPTDNGPGTSPVDFLPSGHSANFVNNSDRSGADYIVLNRVVGDPNRPIAFNGTVRSSLSTSAAGAVGGQVWFYSPSGVLVGATGAFDVGSLLLTANDLNDPDGFLSGDSNSFSFGAASGSRAAVEVQGSINAIARNAYVALIAPRVVQSGSVTVNGTAAYVAAEKVDMTINGSLFDIQIPADGGSGFTGSDRDSAALVHDGTTTLENVDRESGYGPSPTTRAAIMVAVPKNDAVTMLVQGNIAYEQAVDVQQVDGRIILSAGKNVRSDPFSQSNFIQDIPGAAGTANIQISNGPGRSTFETDVEGQATGIASATAVARNETGYGGAPLTDLAFQGSLNLSGAGGASLEAGAGSRVSVTDSVTLTTDRQDVASTARASLIARSGSEIDIGGSAVIEADLDVPNGVADGTNKRTAEVLSEGGTISVASTLIVSAQAEAGFSGSVTTDVKGGTASVTATGPGGIDVGGNLFVEADAFAGETGYGPGGLGMGGTARVEAGAGSTITIGNRASISADGIGGFGRETSSGDGQGGIASVLASGGSIEVGETMFIEANGFGGISFDSDVGYGTGSGGTASLGISTIDGNVGRITVDTIVVAASGQATPFGGEGGDFFSFAAAQSAGAGGGRGGDVIVTIDGDLIEFGERGFTELALDASGSGFPGASGGFSSPAGTGGDGIGGTITVDFRSGNTILDRLSANAGGEGGGGGNSFFSTNRDGGAGGRGEGGAISILASGGSAEIGDLFLDLRGTGGQGGQGASLFGGEGGPGNAGSGGAGGFGKGGDLTIGASGGGTLTVFETDYQALGFGGSGGRGGSTDSGDGGRGGDGGGAQGGTIRFTASDGGTFNARPGEVGYGDVRLEAYAQGGSGGEGGSGLNGGAGGLGGSATGGAITLDIMSGTLDLTPGGSSSSFASLELDTVGEGGSGGDGGEGFNGSDFTGTGGSGGNGGLGKGGSATISVANGSLTVGDVEVTSAGHGGDGGFGGEAATGGDGGRGGDGIGGAANLSLTGATTFTQTGGDIELQAYGLAGDGGNGATGVEAGGQSGAGGTGIGGGGIGPDGAVGGGININLNADNLEIVHITARAKGDGGIGGSGFVESEGIEDGVAAAGGDGGLGVGGAITLASNQGTNRIASRVKFSANGEGGSGGSSESLAGGNGGDGQGGTIRLEGSDTGDLSLAGAVLNAYGLGAGAGSGGDNNIGGNGGRGGDATGGRIELETLQQGKLTIEMGEGGGLQADVRAAAGSAGNGGDGSDVGDTGGRGGNGGKATGGLFAVQIAGGTADLGDVSVDANANGGNGGSGGIGAGRAAVPDNPETPEDESQPGVPATVAPSGSGGDGTGGTIRFDVADHESGDAGILLADTIFAAASGSGGFDPSGSFPALSNAGTIGIFETAQAEAGSIDIGSLDVQAFGSGSVNPNGFELSTDTSRISIGFVNISVDTDASFTGIGDGGVDVADAFNVRSFGGSINFAQDPGADAFLVAARNINLSAASSIGGESAGIFASDDVRASAGAVGLGLVEAGDDILIDGGSVSLRLARTNGEPDEDDGSEGSDGEEFGSNLVVDASGSVLVAEADVAGGIRLNSSSANVGSTIGVTAGNEIQIFAATNVSLADATAGSDVNINAGGNVSSSGTLRSDDDVRVSAGGNISLTNAAADDLISLSGDMVSLSGEGRAGNQIAVFGNSVSLGDLFTENAEFGGEGPSTGIRIFASDAASIRSADSASSIFVEAGGLTAGTLKAATSILVNTLGGEGGNGGPIEIESAQAGNVISLLAQDDVDAGSLIAGTDILVSASAISIGSGTAGRDIRLDSPGAINVTAAEAGDDFLANGASFTGGTIVTTGLGEDSTETGYGSGPGDGSNILVGTTGSIQLDNGNAADRLALRSSATENASTETADASRTVNGGTLRGDVVEIDAAGAVSVNAIQTMANADVESASAITLGSVLAGGNIAVNGAADVTTGNMVAANVQATAAGRLTTGNVMAAVGGLSLSGGTGTLQTGALLAMTTIDLDAQGGTLQTGNIESIMSTVDISTSGDMTLGNVRAGGSIFLTGGARITTGSLVAGTLPPQAAASAGITGLATALEVAMAGIAPGFDDFAFPANDDGATGAIATPFSLNFFGETYEQLFVSNNGYVTFNSGQGTFTPSGLGEGYSGQPIIAAFFADVDTRNPASALMTYGTGDYAGRPAFGATWDGVGYFPSAADKLNNFQIVLTDRTDTGAGNFDIYFNYTRITWETGSASGGSNGFGGVSAAVGYNAGTGNQPGTFFELPGSRIPGSFLDGGPMPLITTTNNGTPGQLQFQVRNGQVNPGGGTGGSFGTGDIRVTNTAPGNTADISLGSLAARDIEVTGAGAVTTGAIDANRDVLLNAAGALTYAGSEADRKTTLTGLSIDGGNTMTGGDLVANGGMITIAEARAGDDITIRADDTALIGAVATTGQGADGEGDGFRIDIEAAGGIDIERVEAAGAVSLIAQNGTVLVSQDLISGEPVTATGRAVTLNAVDALSVGSATATAGNVALTSGGNLSLGTADASGNVTASSGGTLGVTGAVNGTQISLASRDIAIGSSAQVGTIQRTTGIQITANGGSAPVVIGGSASGSGYRLDGAEFSRLAGRDVSISAQGEGGTMQIDALTVRGAGASNPNVTGRLSFAASGDVEMIGTLAFDNATDANSVRVTSGGTFSADAPDAGIAITNGAALAGSIDIDADAIVVASQTAQADLASLTDTDARNDRLGTNDGTEESGGFLRAGSIRLSASDRIHIQNSGANSDEPNDRAGLSAGAGGITLVTNSSTTPVEIIINGRAANPAGGEFTGEALIPELTIVGIEGGAANLAARSTVNGCLILGTACGAPIIEQSPLTLAATTVRELDEEDEEDEDSSTKPPEVGFNRLIEMEGSPFIPVIDEPVTGSGNEDLGLGVGPIGGLSADELNRAGDVDQPVTGTGNEALQSVPNAPLIQLPPVQPQGQQPDVDGPVTGTGNESLQAEPPRQN